MTKQPHPRTIRISLSLIRADLDTMLSVQSEWTADNMPDIAVDYINRNCHLLELSFKMDLISLQIRVIAVSSCVQRKQWD